MLLRLSLQPLARSPLHRLSRGYTRSRFPDSGSVGFGRASRSRTRPSPSQQTRAEHPQAEEKSPYGESELWGESMRNPVSDPEEGLQRLLNEDMLLVTRQLEMLNIFAGFEQANKYAISTAQGKTLGYIAEASQSVLSTVSRQLLRTHRSFRAVIMDQHGTPVLWVHRPFNFIASRMYVQRLRNYQDYDRHGDPILETFAEVQQIWHPWRRQYELFLKEKPRRILTLATDPDPEHQPRFDDDEFVQIAKIDRGLFAWNFPLHDESDQPFAMINKEFRGLGREVFTDTSQYTVLFGSPNRLEILPDGQFTFNKADSRPLTLDERALILATSVNIDFDYFSRHSQGGGGLFPLLFLGSIFE